MEINTIIRASLYFGGCLFYFALLDWVGNRIFPIEEKYSYTRDRYEDDVCRTIIGYLVFEIIGALLLAWICWKVGGTK